MARLARGNMTQATLKWALVVLAVVAAALLSAPGAQAGELATSGDTAPATAAAAADTTPAPAGSGDGSAVAAPTEATTDAGSSSGSGSAASSGSGSADGSASGSGAGSATGSASGSGAAAPVDGAVGKTDVPSAAGAADPAPVLGGDEAMDLGEDAIVDDPEGPRFPMTGEGMARVLAKPWPSSVYAEVEKAKVCHGGKPIDEAQLAKRRICLVTVSYKTPRSLENSVKSWARSGLLDLVDDKIMWLNAATDEERAMGRAHGFRVMEPRHLVKHVFKTDFPQAFHGKRPQKLHVVVRGTERNAWTVAPSFVHAADMTDADYVLFLEKDFMIPEEYTREHVREELLNAVLYMERGIKLFRLRSRKDLGTDGLPNCCSGRRCPGRWTGGNTWTRQRNWFNFFCDKLPQQAVSKKLVAQCDERKTRCFTSYDSNWSNNPFLINRQYIFNGEKGGNIAKVALWSSSQKRNGKFEVNELNNDWGKFHTPICQSWEGLFHHHEIDGRRRLTAAPAGRQHALNGTELLADVDALEESWGANVQAWDDPAVVRHMQAAFHSERGA